MKNVALPLVVLLLGLAPLARAQTGVLVNAGFEEGTGDGARTQDIRGWNRFGSNVWSVTASPRSGMRCVKVSGTSESDELYSGVFQDFPVQPGQHVKVGIYMQHRSDDPLHADTTALTKLEFYDGQTNFLQAIEAAEQLDASSNKDQWFLSTTRGKAPTNAAVARIVGIFVQRFDGTPGAVYFDDASVDVEGP